MTCARPFRTAVREFDFEVPLGTNGDCTTATWSGCKSFKSRQDLRAGAPAAPPEGPWQIDDRKIVPPPKHEVRENMEALIHHFKLVSYGFDVPEGEVYVSIESPRGRSATMWSPTAKTSRGG